MVEPGEMAPVDEYDSYAHHIVSMVAQGCLAEQLSSYLEKLRTGVLGMQANPECDADIASEIMKLCAVRRSNKAL